MPREITDFTKSALTRAFEAKGNLGASLSEQLQPVVVAHSLELGPCPPFLPFAWFAQCTAVAAAVPSVILAPSGSPAGSGIFQEFTFLVDRVILSAPVAQTVGIFVGTGVSVTTPQAVNNVISRDTRRGLVPVPEVTVARGTGVTGGSSVRFTTLELPVSGTQQIDLGLIFAPVPLSGAGDPNMQLLVVGDTVNVALDVALYGRLFAIQS